MNALFRTASLVALVCVMQVVGACRDETPTTPDPGDDPVGPKIDPPERLTGPPDVGDAAPDFTLDSLDGEKTSLADLAVARPLVLVFGAYTCFPFRKRQHALDDLAQRWDGRAEFAIVFSVEPHAAGRMPHSEPQRKARALQMLSGMDADGDRRISRAEFPGNDYDFHGLDFDGDGAVDPMEILDDFEMFKAIPQPGSAAERRTAALRFVEETGTSIPVLLDDMANSAHRHYGSKPNMALVIDASRTVVARFDWGHIDALEQALVATTGAPAPPPTPRPNWRSVDTTRSPVASTPGKPGGRSLLCFRAPSADESTDTSLRALTDPRVVEALASIPLVMLDLELPEVSRLYGELGLRTSPAFVLVEDDGAPVRRLQGAQSPSALLWLLSD